MNKITLEQLNNINITNIKEVDFLGSKIEIKTYLPMEEKLNIAELVLQGSIDYNFVNKIKTETYFNVYAMKKYTNINFNELSQDDFELYDIIEQSGLIQLVINTTEDYFTTQEYTQSLVDRYEQYQNSVVGMASKIMEDIPNKMSQMVNELNDLDINKVVGLFESIEENGGNENAIINTIVGQK